MEAGGTLTLGGTVRGNGDTIKAIQVSVFQNGDHTLGGVCQHLEPGTENFDLSDFDPIVTGETYGNLDMNEGTYDICIYVTLGNGGSFGDDLPTRTVTVIPAGSCAHTAASMIYVETLYREIEGDHVNHQAYADIYSGICDICGSSFETTCLRVEEDIETVCHSYSGGVCQSNGCGHVCPHAWDFKLNNGEPVPVSGSGVWKMVDETSCQKNVRYWMQCAYCAEEKKGTELYPEANNILPHDSETTTEIAQLSTDDVDYNTKHQLTTTHVACTRDCGYTAGSGTEVTKEDHTLVDGVCECGYRPVWNFERDSYSFINWSGYFGAKGSPLYVKQEHLDEWLEGLSAPDLYEVAQMYGYVSKAEQIEDFWIQKGQIHIQNLRNNKLKVWNGSCFGMSLTTGLYRTGAFSTETFDDASCVKELPTLTSDTNSDLESMINIFHMSQKMDCILSNVEYWKIGKDKFIQGMKMLWNRAISITPETIDNIFLLAMGSDSEVPDHAVVCYGAEKHTTVKNGKTYDYRFLLADPNKSDGPNYLYITASFDDACYATWDSEKNDHESKHSYKYFGYYDICLDENLIDFLNIPSVFRSKQLKQTSIESGISTQSVETSKQISVAFNGEHNCTISSASGAVTIENGSITEDTLDVCLHSLFSEEDSEESYCYLLLPKGEDYEIVSNSDEPVSVTVNYGGLIYGANGTLQSMHIASDGTVSVMATENKIGLDIVKNDSIYDFLTVYGQPESEIVLQAEHDRVQVDGDWAECTASHMTRDLETTEVEIADPSNFTVTIDEENNLSVEPTPLVGDVNGDGMLSSADAVLLARYLLGSVTLTDEQLAAADINSDGVITTADTVLLAKKLLAGN